MPAYGALHATASQRLEIYSGSLSGEMSRYDYLPAVLGLNPDIVAALQGQGGAAGAARANAYLTTVASDAKASAIYVMNLDGMTVAASN